MKRKTLISVCAAIALVTAMWSTSLAVATLDGPDTVTAGGTVEFTIRGTELGMSAVIETEGLEFESANGGMSDKRMVILLSDYGGMEAKYTYKVTAAAGQPVSFALTDVTESDGQADSYAPTLTWSGTVGGSATMTEGPQPSRTNQPRPSQAAGTAPATPGATLSGSPSEGASGAPTAATADLEAGVVTDAPTPSPEPTATDGPKTGDTSMSMWVWWVIGIACAVVVVFAARKVFGGRKNQKKDQ